VKSLKLLPLKGLEDLRKRTLAELDDSCSYHKIYAAGFTDPSKLRQYKPAASCVRYVDALEGKTDLEAAFDDMLKERCRNNANTKACLAEAEKKRGDIEEMRIEVQNFGWNNCAVESLLLNQSKSDDMRQKLQQQFFKRYKVKELPCEN
jgi:hypothetical protein